MDALYQFLKWSSIINICLLLLSTIMIAACKNWAYTIHHRLFSIEKQTFNNTAYAFLALYKLLIFFFNLVPLLVLHFMH